MTSVATTVAPSVAQPIDGFDAEVLELSCRLAAGRSFLRRPLRAAHERGMELVSRDPLLRAALFRMVDVAPVCEGPLELAEHLAALLEQVEPGRPPLRWSTAQPARLACDVLPAAWRRGRSIAWPGASSLERRRRRREGAARIVGTWGGGFGSLLGEATVTHAEAQAYVDRCAQTLDVLVAAARRWSPRPLLEADAAGPLPRVNLSVKVTALTPLVSAEAPGRGRADAADRSAWATA